MNISTALLMFLGWQFLSGKNGKKNQGFSFTDLSSLASGFFNDETKNLISSVSKLTSGSGEDKMSALLQMMMNPSIQEFMNGFFGGGKDGSRDENVGKQGNQYTNEEGYTYKDNPSRDAIEFFKPVENIAGQEAAHKLYELYDNWYSKKRK